MRTRVLCAALVLSLSCAGVAFGQEAAKAKRPHRLADLQLDRITAGDSGAGSSTEDIGGTIVAGGSQATITNTAGITLIGAQSGAQALNLVNSVQSRVANGVNVWDGQLDTHDAATTLNVNQSNQVFQQGFASYASLSSYTRGQNVSTNASSSETSKSSSSDNFMNNSSVDTKQTIDASKGSTGNSSTASPSTGLNLQTGQGISGTGKLNIHVDAGSIGLGISGNASAQTESWIGINNVGFKNTDTISAGFKADLNWTLPKLDLSFDGGICYVELGSCSAVGSRTTTSSSEDDKQSSYSQVVQGPVSIDNANAQYIVADGSKLDVTNSYTVFLDGTAEQNAKAINLVNATASLITNAVNIARTPTAGPTLNLNQTNLIVQQH